MIEDFSDDDQPLDFGAPINVDSLLDRNHHENRFKEPLFENIQQTDHSHILGDHQHIPKAKKISKRQKILSIDDVLSEKGLEMLNRKARNIKFNGKGNEAADLSKLINFYQLWLHSMNPNMEFNMAVAKVEKLCRELRPKMFLNACMEEEKRKKFGIYDNLTRADDTKIVDDLIGDDDMNIDKQDESITDIPGEDLFLDHDETDHKKLDDEIVKERGRDANREKRELALARLAEKRNKFSSQIEDDEGDENDAPLF